MSERVAAPRPKAALFATDDKGFVNSPARCTGAQTAVAFGRTERSAVVICADGGRYEYLGVRLRDNAVLRAPAQSAATQGFTARHTGVVYSVSPTELLVMAGDAVVKREPMLEFRRAATAGAAG